MNLSRRDLLQQLSVVGVGSLIGTSLHSHAGERITPMATTNKLSVFRGKAFGTDWYLSVPRQPTPASTLDRIVTVIKEINRTMSPFLTDSVLSRFNQSRALTPFSVSSELLEVVNASLVVAEASNGAFDPTVGPWVNRMGFGPIQGSLESNFKDIVTGKYTIRKRRSNVTLDVCGIAKGYALDRITALLEYRGFPHFLFELGGELSARGHHPDNRPWQVAIDTAASDSSSSPVVRIHHGAVATSGAAHNGYAVADKRFSHLINSSRSAETDSGLHSVTVLHKSAMFADAWATALFVMGSQFGAETARRVGLDSLFLGDPKQGGATVTTGKFAEFLETVQ